MTARQTDLVRILLTFGGVAFVVALLSIFDMFLPRPWDGVVVEADSPGRLIVRKVVPESGAARAGLQPGDEIIGIGRELLRSPAHAAQQVNRYRIGETVPYFVRTPGGGASEVAVELGRRQIGSPSYLYACLIGFCFFGVGLFIFRRQPAMRAAQVFFLLSTLFMLFLICRLRPASYSMVDTLVLATGTAALLFLPATFLHFYLLFPYPIWMRLDGMRSGFRWSPTWVTAGLVGIYLLPPLVLIEALMSSRRSGVDLPLISGAPAANWWILGLYMVLGLAALAINAGRLSDRRERHGSAIVFAGSVLGLAPFLVLAVGFPALFHSERFLFWGVIPLILVPLTFAFAIIRFQLLDIRVMLRRSLLYTLSTAVVTAVYALGIGLFNRMFAGTGFAESIYSPILLALAIILLFEPLRRRLQGPVDRFFFADRERLRRATVEMGDALSARPDLDVVVQELVEKLPQQLKVHFAALYLAGEDRLERTAGPESLPATLERVPVLHEELQRRNGLARLEEIGTVGRDNVEALRAVRQLADAGVEVVGDLATPRRSIGFVLLSGKSGSMAWEQEEFRLLRGLLSQAAIALETHLLLEERTRQAELERDLEIAASIQASLLPETVEFSEGWQVAAVCRPARHVGGDFIARLPAPAGHTHAVAYGDVSGKSVSGALVMMAAYEILHSLALTEKDPEELMRLANERLYKLGRKSFVALTYLAPSGNGGGLSYLLAGQPQPLKRSRDGQVLELPLPEQRLPLGALQDSRYQLQQVAVEPGEVILGFSDGVVDARSASGEFFGTERLERILAGCDAGPQDIVAEVLGAVDSFTGGAEPYDDLTLLAVSRQAEASR